MPSKLRKAIDAVKDQTSIGLAKVSSGTNATSLEVAILKATTHDEVPFDDRYVNEILQLISSNKAYAAACAQSIGKRITKTRNWIVALKSLNLILRIFQDGDPFFPREVLHAMKRGAKILNLSNFRDDSNSSPWDYTAFVRTFALYLDERLDCFLTGKLQKHFTNWKAESNHGRSRRYNEPIREMKPAILIDKISCWQKLLDRAIATRPTGSAKTNRLVQLSLHAIVQESFDLYRDISDGLALLLDSFFHLQYQSCVNAFQACVKAARQFEELGSFYDLCKSIGVGRTSEYPSVQQPSDELIETLQEFLKDQASFPSHGCRSPPAQVFLPSPSAKDPVSTSKQTEDFEQSESSDRNSERGSDLNSQCASLGDLMSAAEGWTSPTSVEPDRESYSDYQSEKQSQQGDFVSANDTESCHSLTTTHGSNLVLNFASFDDGPQQENVKRLHEEKQFELPSVRYGDWELVLAESASESMQESGKWPNVFEPSIGEDLFVKSSTPPHQYNPFLQDADDIFAPAPAFNAQFAVPETEMAPTFRAQSFDDTIIVAPTFHADAALCSLNDLGVPHSTHATPAPTFHARGPTESAAKSTNQRALFALDAAATLKDGDDPFAVPWRSVIANDQRFDGSMDQDSMLQQRKLWMEQQNKIIAKRST